MSRPKLRVYCGPEDDAALATAEMAVDRVIVPLGEILPLLAEAYRSRRLWLKDFSDDEVAISSDLYEMLLAYEDLHRPSA